MERAFLVAAAAGLALVANGLRPAPPGTPLSVPSFFAGWLTTELAPQLLVAHLGGVAAFAAAGAVRGAEGAAGLAMAALSAGGLVRMVAESLRARRAFEGALGEPLDGRVPWRQLLLPFVVRDRRVERVRNVPYGPHGRRNRLDVYRPRGAGAGRPVLVQVHGGGWVVGSKEQQGRPLMVHLASRGWVCVAVNYRLSPRATFPDHLVDVKRALAWVREHVHEHGGDPRFVVITGGSAGGHLAALAALTAGDRSLQPGFEEADTSVAACVPFYGVYDLTEAGTRWGRGMVRFLERLVVKKPFARYPEAYEAASPLLRVRPDAPPFFVIHGDRDSLAPVAQARRFVERLREVSASPVVYAELPGAQHAFDVFASIRTAYAVRAVERFAARARGVR